MWESHPSSCGVAGNSTRGGLIIRGFLFFNIVAQFSIIILSATYSVILFNPNLSVISFLLLYVQSVERETLGSRPPPSLSRPTWVTKISYVMLKLIQFAS